MTDPNIHTYGKAPQNVQLIGLCLVIGGSLSLITSAAVLLSTLCIWIIAIYGIIAGIFAIVRGAALLGGNSRGVGTPTTAAVMLIVNVINFDSMGLIAGIIALVLMQDDATRGYLQGDPDILD